ncbi:Protein NLP5 [Linum grandiflorum]
MDVSWQSGMMLGLQADALTNTVMDSDYIDDFLLDSSWLEATDVSEFLGATLDNADTSAAAITSQSRNEQGNQLSLFLDNDPSQNLVASESDDGCDDQTGFSIWENGKKKRQTGARPQNQSCTSSVRDRLTGAIGCIRDLINDKDALVQIWVPKEEMGRRVLTTHDQPFALDGGSQRLANYRDVSSIYQFPAEEESADFSKVITSMPGRVFLAQVPEWSPDVQLFTSEEYPRVDHARKYNVRGTLAVPVFEQMSEACLGVIEIVTTRQGIKYQSELEKVSKALEAVDLRSCGAPIFQTIKETADMAAYQAALPEIKQVLKTACETHELPLAQTWIPCTIRQHPDENCSQHCVSTVDEACVIHNPKVKGFHEACSEQHLLKGQGVVGRALATNEPCFSSNITSYSKDEYPLSSHARVFGLCGAVAIRLRSVITGEADFVLEFFLPGDCRTPDEQHKMLNSLSVVVGEACQTLRVVTDEELECEKAMDFWDQKGNEEGWKLGKPVVERKRTKSERKISLEILRQHFSGTLKDAAISLGVCSTTLKRICRQHGITRWPSRKLKKVGHSLKKLQVVMDSVEGTSGSLHINSFYTNFPNLDSNPREPTPSIIITQPDQDTSGAKPTSSPSSCSQTSASSAEPVRSPAGEEQVNVVVSKNSSNRVQRVKVAYGDEIVRFRISSSWGYEDLLVEIGRRFGIEEMKRFDVKYLDDDSEWVLLTCDEDFEECVEVCHSSLNQTVKLLLQVSSRAGSD